MSGRVTNLSRVGRSAGLAPERNELVLACHPLGERVAESADDRAMGLRHIDPFDSQVREGKGQDPRGAVG